MVDGFETFKRHFSGFEDSFVLIGGTACDLWFTHLGGRFRRTKDIDMVLVAKALTPDFVRRFWMFAKAGGYEVGRRTDGRGTYYRFTEPTQPGYPAMLELFSRALVAVAPDAGQTIVHLPTDDDVSSLSAILMEGAYYDFVLTQRDTVDGAPVIRPACLIPLKARAWLDLTARKAGGEEITEDDIRKHRNDVFRLSVTLPGDSGAALPDELAADVVSFLDQHPPEHPDWPAIRQSIRRTVGGAIRTANLIAAIRDYYRLGGKK